MTNNKSRPQCKCRVWERDRRNRLSQAFAALANVLPSGVDEHGVPLPSTKLFILQMAVKYIKELQQKNEKLDNKPCETNSALLEKLSILEERCSKLIQQMQNAGLTVSPLLTSIIKPLNKPQLSPSSIVHDITNVITKEENEKLTPTKINSDNDSNKCVVSESLGVKCAEASPLTSTPDNNDSSEFKDNKNDSNNSSKNLRKPKRKYKKKKPKQSSGASCCNLNNVPHHSAVMQKNNTVNNVWVTPNNQNGPLMFGNTILPFMPIASPVLMASTPQTPTFFLVQRPSNTNNVINIPNLKNLSGQKMQEQIHKIYSNTNGFDVTKTTMVNKMPISAFSSGVTSKSKNGVKSVRPMRVTQRSRSLFLNSQKSKKPPIPTLKKNNKENISEVTKEIEKAEINSPVIEDKSVSDPIAVENISKEQNIEKNNCKPQMTDVIVNETQMKTPELEKNDLQESNNVKKQDSQITDEKMIVDDKNDIEVNDQQLNILNESVDASTNEKNMIVSDDNKMISQDIDVKETLVENKDKGSDLNTDSSKPATVETAVEKNCDIEKADLSRNIPPSNLIKNKNDKLNHVTSNNFESVDENLMNQTRDTECKLPAMKNNVLANANIPEDLLDSFDAPAEQTMPNSPLISSPLATSPTAAFLLAFPLVCPGPRPDTPLNDNLQTPNICSLDNFSTFFSSKEPCGTSNNIHSHIFSDCISKHSPEKIKHNWSHILNSQNSLKPLTEVKYPVKYDMKNLECHKITDLDKVANEKLPTSTSAACVYSDHQNIFQNSKITNVHHYVGQENMYNYDNLSLLNNSKANHLKDAPNDKLHINFGSSLQNNSISKDKSQMMNSNTVVPNFLENTPTSISCNKTYNPGIMSNAINDSSNCKKLQTSDNCMKLILPGVIPDISTSKIPEVSFGINSQGKSTLHNSSNIYTSCNTYNPFGTDFSSNSMNLSLTCANSLNPIRTKSTTTYFPDFNTTNIYSQNCNIWTDDTQNDFDPAKIDYNRKLNLPISLNQNQSNVVSDFQTDLRFTFPVISKSNKQTVNTEVKTSKNNKFVNKELKFSSNDTKNKSDFVNQKGPVNWMTSDVTAQQNNDMFFHNYKDIKLEQNLTLPNAGQTCLDTVPSLPGITSLNCKKTDILEQPFYHLQPGSYVSQVINEDNQFTWSPSKLNSYGDNLSLAPCTLPTLVGDLALGIATESKLAYQANNLEQEAAKERKILQQKNGNKSNCTQNVEMNNHGVGHFLSVSQLMERGKMTNVNIDNNASCKPSIQENKRNVTEDRLYNSHGTNKPYESIPQCGTLPIFTSDSYLNQQHVDNTITVAKETHFQNKIDTNVKNVNKNNYSTEALLQNNSNYQNSRKYKQNFNYNSNYPLPSNQFISSNHPLQFENFTQNQQYTGNTFPYSNPSATMNTSFYSSSNFITSSNTMPSSNYISSGFSADLTEFPGNGSENIFFTPKIDNSKSKLQNDFTDISKYSQKITTSSKDMKTKSEVCIKKDSAPPSKRQKKHKNAYPNNYPIPERCFNPASNQIANPSMAMDESYFGYATGQMHTYPSQSALLSNIQLPSASSQKNTFPAAKPNMSSPPNAVGNSLTNFNLSAIFPEINKRNNMTGFNEPQQPSSLTKTIQPDLYH